MVLSALLSDPAWWLGGRELNQRLTEVVFLALDRVLPARIPAAGKDIIVSIGFGGHDPKRNEYYCDVEIIAAAKARAR